MESNPMFQGFPNDYVNPRKIPKAVFFDNIEEVLKNEKTTEEALKKSQQEKLNKYLTMDRNISSNMSRMKLKIPEIRSSLEAVRHLKKKKEEEETLISQFKLTEGVFANATLKMNGKVNLWLGANTMVEFSYDEADDLLSKNLETATKNLNNLNEDSAYLKDQITIAEVNIARIHNYGVKLRQQAKKK
eukprot:gene5140-8746_t